MVGGKLSPTISGIQKVQDHEVQPPDKRYMSAMWNTFTQSWTWKSKTFGTVGILGKKISLVEAVVEIRTMDRARSELAEPIQQQVRFSDKSTWCGGLEEAQILPRDALIKEWCK